MSCSKPLPPFTFDLLCYLNRDQLKRFSIVCRPLKNLIERYFHSKPFCVFDSLWIYGGSYALFHKDLQWHPNRDDSSGQQFSAVQQILYGYKYYSFAEVRPYLDQTVRIKETVIYVAGDSIYNPEHIAEMESIAYLWRDAKICIDNASDDSEDECQRRRIVAMDFQPILNSPTILQCRILYMNNAHFSFKDYKILYTVKLLKLDYDENYCEAEIVDPNSWLQFLVQPGVKPVVVLLQLEREDCDDLIDILSKDFSSAVSPNAFKILFNPYWGEELTEFRETNITSGEILELKKGLPVECQNEFNNKYTNYTLERSILKF